MLLEHRELGSARLLGVLDTARARYTQYCTDALGHEMALEAATSLLRGPQASLPWIAVPNRGTLHWAGFCLGQTKATLAFVS